MSSAVKKSPKTPLDYITKQVSGIQITETPDSVDGRIEQYVHNLHHHKQQEGSLPLVERRTRRGCFVFCQSICSAWSCCQAVTCCGSNYYYTENINGNFVLANKIRFRPPTEEQKIMTKAAFFLELYNIYGEYLIPAWKESVQYIEKNISRGQASYWKDWDVQSEDLVEPKKERFFRDIIDLAATIIQESREQVMRQQIMKREKTPSSSLNKQHSSEEEASDSPVRFLSTSSSSAGRRIVQTAGLAVEFNKEKIVKDVESMTLATAQQAAEIAEVVEQSLEFPCTGEKVWETVKDRIIEKDIKSKEVDAQLPIDEISARMKDDFYLKNQNPGFLEAVIATRREGRRKKEQFRRAVQSVITQEKKPIGTSSLNVSEEYVAQQAQKPHFLESVV